MNIVERIGRVCLSIMFLLSVGNNLTGGFQKSVNLVKKLNFPLPVLSVIGGLIIKFLGSMSLIFGYKETIILPFLIGFLILITILANNPIQYPEKKYMFFTLIGVIGGLLIVYNNSLQKQK